MHAITVFGMDSVEYQIKCGSRFRTEAQNSTSLFRPNEFTACDLPSEGSRVAQFLRLGQVLPPPLQLSLRCRQVVIGLLKCTLRPIAPSAQDAKCQAEPLSSCWPMTKECN